MKKKPHRLKSEPYKKWLKNELEFWFPKYIVLRDGKCVICGSTEGLTNGHYFSRRNLSTKRDKVNCSCQCTSCNYNHENNPEPYRRYLVGKIGEQGLNDLEQKRHSLFNPTVSRLEDMVGHYSEAVCEMIGDRKFGKLGKIEFLKERENVVGKIHKFEEVNLKIKG